MAHPILGVHHVTATVDDAQADLDFCVRALGLRLVKKTVNFDNHGVYHFYYGNERGTPGTIWTTFPYKGQGVPVGKKGAGQVVVTSFSVPTGSLSFWKARLKAHGVEANVAPPKFGEDGILFSDASGLLFELVETTRDARAPWTGGGVGADAAIRGFHSVTMVVQSTEKSLALMTEVLGFAVVQKTEGRVRVAVGGDAPGHAVDLLDAPKAPPAQNGLGTVHHIAFAINTEDEQLRLREDLIQRGLRVTPVMDRCYFKSIYFREPGGVLFEVATVAPGFAADESPENLGRGLKLPPWEEANRPAIEAALPAVKTTPGAAETTPGVEFR
jgi:glyoxalase family protein